MVFCKIAAVKMHKKNGVESHFSEYGYFSIIDVAHDSNFETNNFWHERFKQF